jgi:hypothetical protein
MDLESEVQLRPGGKYGDKPGLVRFIAVDELLALVSGVEDVEADPAPECRFQLELFEFLGRTLREGDFEAVLAIPRAPEKRIQFQITCTERSLGEGRAGHDQKYDQSHTDKDLTHLYLSMHFPQGACTGSGARDRSSGHINEWAV